MAAGTQFKEAQTNASHRIYLSPVGRLLHPIVRVLYRAGALIKVVATQEAGSAHYVINNNKVKPPSKTTSAVGPAVSQGKPDEIVTSLSQLR